MSFEQDHQLRSNLIFNGQPSRALLANIADCLEHQGMTEECEEMRKEATEIYKAANVAQEVLEHMSPLERRRQRVANSPQKGMTSALTFHMSESAEQAPTL